MIVAGGREDNAMRSADHGGRQPASGRSGLTRPIALTAAASSEI